MEPVKPVVSMWLWVVLIIVVLIGGGFFAWYYLIGPGKTETKTATTNANTANTASTQESNGACDLEKITGLTAGATWDIQGGETFSTAVCGYLKTETVHNEMDNVTNDIASLVITSYKDPGFKQTIEKGINEGNTVNATSGVSNEFGLGCYENGQITFNVPNDLGLGANGTIDAASTLKLKNATAAKPVAVKLDFMKHLGSGCNCCNLAEKVEVQ